MTLPQTPYRLGEGTPLPDLTPLSTIGASIVASVLIPSQAWCPRCFRAGYGPADLPRQDT